AELCRHESCQISNFHGMLQYVLTIACPVFQPSENFDQIWMQAMYPDLKGRLFAVFANSLVDFLARLLDHLFDAGRVDTAIGHQLLQRSTGNFASDGIKARQNDRFRCIVDYEIDTGQCFQSTDIAAFTSDNA